MSVVDSGTPGLDEYNVPISNGMRLRHDAQARFAVTSGQRTLEDGLTSVEALGGAVARASFTYNRLAYSGGVSWWDPSAGRAISRPQFTMLVREQDVLRGDEECGCTKCVQ